MNLEAWLDELRALPAASPEWERITEFLAAVLAIQQEKDQERLCSRRRLSEEIERLALECPSELRYFEQIDAVLWIAERAPTSQISGLAQRVEEYRDALEEHASARRQIASTRSQERERFTVLADLQIRIERLYSELAPTLAPTADQLPPSARRDGPAPNAPGGYASGGDDSSIDARTAGNLGTGEETGVPAPPRSEGALDTDDETTSDQSMRLIEESPADANPIENTIVTPDAPQSALEPVIPHERSLSEAPVTATAGAPVIDEGLDTGLLAPSNEVSEHLLPNAAEAPTTPTAAGLAARVETPEGALEDEPLPPSLTGVSGLGTPEVAAASPSGQPVPTLARPTNPNPQQAANALQQIDHPAGWVEFFWSLIREDELPAAYWLARSLPDTIGQVVVPPSLVAAVYGARRLSDAEDLLVLDLVALAQEFRSAAGPEQQLMQLAAALVPSLIAPAAGLASWLSYTDTCPALHPVVERIREFVVRGVALHPADLQGVVGQEEREVQIRAASQAAEQWLSGEKERQPRGNASVRAYLLHHDLTQLLSPVTQDQRQQVHMVRQQLNRWQRDHILERINAINRELKRARAWEISAGTRDPIVHDVGEAVHRALQWCRLVERENLMAGRGDWLMQQIAELRTAMQEALPDAEVSMMRIAESSGDAALTGAALCLARSLAQLRRTLHMPPSRYTPPLAQDYDLLAEDLHRLEILLGRQLLWLPELELDDHGQPALDGLSAIAPAIRDAFAERRTLRDVVESWLKQGDCRLCQDLIAMCPDPGLVSELKDRAHSESERLKEMLRTDIATTQDQVEQAVVDGIIAEERSDYVAQIEKIEPDRVRNFARGFAILQDVREKLTGARRTRMEEVHASVQSLEPQLSSSHLDPARQERIRAALRAALERGDTRVVDECLARVRETLDTGADLEEDWLIPPPTRDPLRDYMDIRARLEDKLSPKPNRLAVVMTDLRKGNNRWGLQYAQLPVPRRQEASEALEAWEELRRLGASEPNNRHRIAVLLRFLGFTLSSEPKAAVTIEQGKQEWLHARASMSASGLAKPIPQFGSMAQGRYDVLCLWERPAADVVRARVHDLRLDTRGLILFYLGRLSQPQRHELTRLSRDQELAIALLDDTLLLLLTAEGDARLPVFLRCSLPFAAVNPYTPFQAGDVPPEMFFGREGMARELLRPEGSCLVYGGRQLGKSALLRHVQRQYENPKRSQYAWVEDIKLIGDPQAGEPPSSLWRRLRDGFVRAGLFKPVAGESAEGVSRQVRELMARSPDLRVLVMFDEADNFLTADARDGFQVVTGLRELMLHTQRRFKVVFAGLHHVQQFQGIPNQPLAHFGRPILVGPLEPDAAQRLVREPFEALGFRFDETEAGILRILSYTNYHPGLIQLFCEELLKRLRSRPGRETPPYRIVQSDIEAVYRKVRTDVRDRFDWTLALDPRYQAIAWAMVENQLSARDSFARPFPPSELLHLVGGWWPQGFAGVETDQFHALLDEMCGLGVLVRNMDGHYRLRSPNLVRLMGAQEDIEARLLEFAEKAPEVRFDVDAHHAALDDERRRYSPLTHAQERGLNVPHFGVGLIFASEALGYQQLPDVVRRFIPADRPEASLAECSELDPKVQTEEEIRERLRSYSQERPKFERLVVYQMVTGSAQNLETRVRSAIRFCGGYRQRTKQWLRVFFLFDPSATWSWLSLPLKVRRDLENQVDFATHPRRWNLAAVRQRLAQHPQEKMSTNEVCQRILDVTGGWPCLLDALFDLCAKQTNPRPAADALEAELTTLGSRRVREFQRGLGVEPNSPPGRLMKHILKEGVVLRETMGQALSDSGDEIDVQTCVAAAEYLHWLGCLVWEDDLAQIEPVVSRMMTVQ